MPLGYERQGYPEGLWDIARLARGGGRARGFAATARLSPTAATPAIWALVQGVNTNYVWSVRVTTDTAIGVALVGRVADPGLTIVAVATLGLGSSTGTFEAAVAAAPSFLSTYHTALLQPGGPYELLAPGWFCGVGGIGALMVQSDIKAATMSVCIMWAEMAD